MDRARPSHSQDGSAAILDQIQTFRDFGWVSNPAPLFEELGVVLVSAKSYPVPDELQIYWQQVVLLAAEDVTYSYVAINNGASDAPGPRLRRVIHEAIVEMKRGCRMTWDPIVFLERNDKNGRWSQSTHVTITGHGIL